MPPTSAETSISHFGIKVPYNDRLAILGPDGQRFVEHRRSPCGAARGVHDQITVFPVDHAPRVSGVRKCDTVKRVRLALFGRPKGGRTTWMCVHNPTYEYTLGSGWREINKLGPDRQKLA